MDNICLDFGINCWFRNFDIIFVEIVNLLLLLASASERPHSNPVFFVNFIFLCFHPKRLRVAPSCPRAGNDSDIKIDFNFNDLPEQATTSMLPRVGNDSHT